MAVGGGGVRVAVGARVAVGGSGVLDGTGVVVGVGLGDGVAVWLGVVVGGIGVNVAVWVGSGVGVWLGGTSWGCVATGLAIFVTVAGGTADPMATCVRVAVGAGAAGTLQPVLSMPTITIAMMIGMDLPKRSIAHPLYLVSLMPPRSVAPATAAAGARR